jgi:photosystem II stability/assembly factor-like uncharacterized protein
MMKQDGFRPIRLPGSLAVAALTAVLLIPIPASRASAQTQQPATSSSAFKPLVGLPGAQIGKIAVDPNHPATLYAGSEVGGTIFKSTDGGSSWSKRTVGGSGFRAIAVDPANSNIVLAFDAFGSGNVGGLFESTNAGSTWARLPHQPGGTSPANQGRGLAISQSGTSITVADRSTGIFASSDSGKSWSNTLPESSILPYGLFVDPNHPSTLWAVGLDRSANHAPAAWTSTDFGKSWKEIKLSILPANEQPLPYDLVIQPKTGRILLGWSGTNPTTFATVGGIIASNDNGKNWANSSTGLSANFDPGNEMVFDPTAANTVYAPGFNTSQLYRSIDAGAHWTSISGAKGLDAAASYFTITATPAASGVAAAILAPDAGEGVFRSGDHGQSWTDEASGLDAQGVVQIEDDGGTTGGLYAVSASERLYHGIGGANWTSIDNWPAASQVHAIAVDRLAKAHTIYALTFDGSFYNLWRSENAGGAWTQLPAPLNDDGFNAVYLSVDPTVAGRVFLSEGTIPAILARSTDFGATWKSIQVGAKTDAFDGAPVFDPVKSGAVYAPLYTAQGAPELFKSADGGATWAQLTAFPAKTGQITGLAITPGSPSAIFAALTDLSTGQTSSVLKSVNGGGSWKAVTVPAGLPAAALVSDPTGKRLFAASACFGISPTAQVSQSTNGGATWQVIDSAIETSFTPTSCATVLPTAGSLFLSDAFGIALFQAPYGALPSAVTAGHANR